MDLLEHLRNLSSQMEMEPAEDTGCPRLSNSQQEAINVFNAQLPNGRQIRLLKTLLSSACENDCNYCPFRAGRDFRRTTLKPDDMAQVFNILHLAGVVQGIFLSSGMIGGGIRTQDQLIATAEILRKKYAFQGYIHLKLMPGSEYAQVERTMQFADRVSLNLESPNMQYLGKLAPGKVFLNELLQPLRWMEQIRQTVSSHRGWKNRWPSMTTQFVVGAVGESDLDLLRTTEYLIQELRLVRAYYSSFRPVAETPFENLPPSPPIREHRLYQASFLLRDYAYQLEELPFESNGNLPMKVDPKLAWAQSNLLDQPVDINRASRHELLRVPGIGPKSADKILSKRREGIFHSLEDLFKVGINSNRAAPFILLDGKQPHRQLSFW